MKKWPSTSNYFISPTQYILEAPISSRRTIDTAKMSAATVHPQACSLPPTSALRAPSIRKNGNSHPQDRALLALSSHSKGTGKQWHAPKSAFRPTAGQTLYAKRTEIQKAQAVTKAKEREMKGEKEAERQVCAVNYWQHRHWAVQIGEWYWEMMLRRG